MAVTQKLVTSQFHVASAAEFIESSANTEYFVYAARHIPYAGSDSDIPTVNNDVQSSVYDQYNNMIFAKKVSNTNLKHMISKTMWSSNTHYSMYDHTDANLEDKTFFVVVDDDTEYNVWKCLFNNSNSTVNATSTTAPSRDGDSGDLLAIDTGDGYLWKYMYTITQSEWDDFATTAYAPVTANSDVISGATSGTVEVIKIANRGAGYNNYIANGTFLAADISVGGITTQFGAPATAAAIDDYYRGCVLKMTSGAAIEEYRRIINYEGTSSKTFTLDRAFTNTPSAGDTYEVYPYLYVWGDGNETTVAEGLARIDSAGSNGIANIEMLSVGAGYRAGVSYPSEQPSSITLPVGISSTLIELPSVISSANTFVAANLVPIISPPGGHGSDPYNELFAKRVCVSAKFEENESGVISTENDFRQIGIVKSPLFTQVDVPLSNTVGPGFSIGETVYQYKKLKLHGNVSITNASTSVLKTDFGLLSDTANIVSGGTGYDSTANNQLVFDNTGTGGSGATATFANNGSGVITSVTVTAAGTGYTSSPTITVNGDAGGSNAVITIPLKNPDEPTYDSAFSTGDYFIVTNGSNNFISTVSGTPNAYAVTAATNSNFTASNCEIFAVKLQAYGTVTSSTTGLITLTNVTGEFSNNEPMFGIGGTSNGTVVPVSGTTAMSNGTIQVNERSTTPFTLSKQMTRLVGDFTGTEFTEDEIVNQNSLVSYAKPTGRVHHLEENGGSGDDILSLTNVSGIFNLDPAGVRTVIGNTSGAQLTSVTNKYSGDFVKDSGNILYIENVDPIKRDGNKSEIIKIVLEF